MKRRVGRPNSLISPGGVIRLIRSTSSRVNHGFSLRSRAWLPGSPPWSPRSCLWASMCRAGQRRHVLDSFLVLRRYEMRDHDQTRPRDRRWTATMRWLEPSAPALRTRLPSTRHPTTDPDTLLLK